MWSGLEQQCSVDCLSKQILIKSKTLYHPVAFLEPAIVLLFTSHVILLLLKCVLHYRTGSVHVQDSYGVCLMGSYLTAEILFDGSTCENWDLRRWHVLFRIRMISCRRWKYLWQIKFAFKTSFIMIVVIIISSFSVYILLTYRV